MKRLLVAASAVWALSLAFSSQASAQHYGCGSGYGYGGGYSSPRLSFSVGYGGNSRFGSGYSGFNSGYSGYGGHSGYGGYPAYGGHVHQTWHDTSHYDYHAPSLVPHRGHSDYVPGHYDLYQTGHWDRHGH